MQTHMNDQLFELLSDTSMPWGEDWREQADRFENYSHEDVATLPSYDWKMSYWFHEELTSMILARSWIIEQGHDCEILWDLVHREWVLVTNYLSPVWRRAGEGND